MRAASRRRPARRRRRPLSEVIPATTTMSLRARGAWASLFGGWASPAPPKIYETGPGHGGAASSPVGPSGLRVTAVHARTVVLPALATRLAGVTAILRAEAISCRQPRRRPGDHTYGSEHSGRLRLGCVRPALSGGVGGQGRRSAPPVRPPLGAAAVRRRSHDRCFSVNGAPAAHDVGSVGNDQPEPHDAV